MASILASTLILVLFRWMKNSEAVTRHAIVVGYLTSAVCGLLVFQVDWEITSQPWFWLVPLEGLGFYIVFRMMALTTEQAGITVASIATKMSVVIPTLIGMAALGESVSTIKIAGLVFGTLAIISAAGTKISFDKWLLPLLVFFCTGLIDASFKLFQVWGLTDEQFPGFVITIFGFAFLAGAIHHMIQRDRLMNHVSIFSGMLLGLANLGTVYFILKALAQPRWESSIVFPVNNFGIVFMSTLTAILFFGERPVLSTKISLFCAAISIGLLYLASQVS